MKIGGRMPEDKEMCWGEAQKSACYFLLSIWQAHLLPGQKVWNSLNLDRRQLCNCKGAETWSVTTEHLESVI
jgi:hypothetical protein